MAPRPLLTDEFHEITMGRHQWLDMDPLTFSKIVQVQLEDMEHLSSRAKGKQREGTVTDAQFAMQVYVDDLAHSDDYFSDRVMAENVAAALRDPPAIGESSRSEHQIDPNREFSSNVAVGTLAQANRRSIMQELQNQQSDPLKELWPALVDSDSDESLIAAESSTWAAARIICDVRSKRRCIACSEERLIRDLATIPCRHEHEYCRDCLSKLIQLAIDDESFFPPKCDGDVFPVDAFAEYIPRSLLDQYHSKAAEYRTKDRTYCHESACAAFIPPDSIDGLSARCTTCWKTTCIVCKSAGHVGDCINDSGLQELKETADTERWQKCYMCNQIVQLEQGCNHIKCRCGTQFCYACGARWKTCDCEYWEEGQLLDESVTHFFEPPPPPLPPRPAPMPINMHRIPRKPLICTYSKTVTEVTAQNATAPTVNTASRPRFRLSLQPPSPRQPRNLAQHTQCAIQ